ncbi:MAG: extracellular solute-binding protein [Spirochaetaceae bacterium]|nr:extracellular solute-binding protein [Spirochaetaceae bacterium]
MKKILYAAMAVVMVLAVLGLGACKKNEPVEDKGKVTLRALNYLDLTHANSSDDLSLIWGRFETDNPDITIIREDLYNEPFHQKTEAYAAAGQLPDVLYAWPSGRSTTLHTKKLLKDLTPLIRRDGLDKVFAPAAIDPSAQGGGFVAILPIALTSTHAFYINNEVLRDCGLTPAKTYSDLKAQVPVLKAKGYDTVIMANAESWVMQSCLFSLVAGRFGGEGWEQKILSGEAKFTDPDFVNALKFIKTMYDDGVLGKATLGTNYGDVLGAFASNKGAYLIDGDWRVGAFITDKTTKQALIDPAKQAEFIEISIFPDIEGAKLNGSTSGILGTGFGMSAAIPAGSVREEAAWKLVKWLVSNEVETLRVANGGVATPSRIDIDIASLALEPMQKAIVDLGSKYETSTAVIDGVFHSDVFTPLNDGLQELGIGSKTPEQIADTVQQAFDNWRALNP